MGQMGVAEVEIGDYAREDLAIISDVVEIGNKKAGEAGEAGEAGVLVS